MKKEKIKSHFNAIAVNYDGWKKKNSYYYSEIKRLFSSFIPKKSNVIDIGCGTGEILNHVEPARGVGIDISDAMIKIAKEKFSHLRFINSDIDNLSLDRKFDYVIMADIIDHLPDIWETFVSLKKIINEDTKIIITTINLDWEPLLLICEKLGLKMPEGPHNFISIDDLINLLVLNNFQIEQKGASLLIPIYIPFISNIINKLAAKIPFLQNLCVIKYLVVSYKDELEKNKNLTCSVIVPCHNEAENIEECIKRIPRIGKYTEIIVVDDGSTDGTKEQLIRIKKERDIKFISYPTNKGKGYAVKAGFDFASGDILMILDADMTVMPEELPRFFIPFVNDHAEFVNGARMIYPVSKQAMRRLHLFGNKVFTLILSWLMNKRITDTLCGTKALYAKDYKKMKMGHCRWGDFDLLFGAAKLNLNIAEMPVHYKHRVAGKSKMRTFKHGLLLLRMCFRGFVELKLKI